MNIGVRLELRLRICDIDAVLQLSATDGFGNQPKALVWVTANTESLYIGSYIAHTHTTNLLERHQLPGNI